MAQRGQRTILFVDAGDGAAARAAATALTAAAGRMGLPWRAVARTSADVSEEETKQAAIVITLGPVGRDLTADRREEWAADPAGIEAAVMDLVARLLGGGGRPTAPPPAPAVKEPRKPKPTVRVGRETKGRRGKGVTTVFDLPLSEGEIEALAARLKTKCGTGGTVKDGRIEIQGDQRDRIAAELEALGYVVKRTGG